jgi:hypothetical protein
MSKAWREIEEERRDAEQSGGRIFFVILVAGLAFMAGRYFVSDRSTPDSPPPAASVVEAPQVLSGQQEIEVPRTAVDPAPVVVGPSQVEASGRSVGVFECNEGGQKILSDRPCAGDARMREVVIDDPDPYEAAAARQRAWAASATPPRVVPSQAQTVAGRASETAMADEPDPNAAQCAWVDRQIEHLNAQMRQGYTSQQGEYYRERWHQLKEQRQALKCGR